MRGTRHTWLGFCATVFNLSNHELCIPPVGQKATPIIATDLDGENVGTENRNSRPSEGGPKCDRFYFINKSEKSTHLSQSSSTEQAAIQSHVQRGRRRSRRGKSVSFAAYAHFKSNKGPVSDVQIYPADFTELASFLTGKSRERLRLWY